MAVVPELREWGRANLWAGSGKFRDPAAKSGLQTSPKCQVRLLRVLAQAGCSPWVQELSNGGVAVAFAAGDIPRAILRW